MDALPWSPGLDGRRATLGHFVDPHCPQVGFHDGIARNAFVEHQQIEREVILVRVVLDEPTQQRIDRGHLNLAAIGRVPSRHNDAVRQFGLFAKREYRIVHKTTTVYREETLATCLLARLAICTRPKYPLSHASLPESWVRRENYPAVPVQRCAGAVA